MGYWNSEDNHGKQDLMTVVRENLLKVLRAEKQTNNSVIQTGLSNSLHDVIPDILFCRCYKVSPAEYKCNHKQTVLNEVLRPNMDQYHITVGCLCKAT